MNNEATTKNVRTFRRLEDLNLIDNFLFQQMLMQEEDGEKFARILLSTILGKKIRNVKITSQKNILGIDTDKHGIRLDAYIEDVSDADNPDLADAEIIPDIYDIEPNNSYEKETLPKRTRYYHGLIDTQLLATGAGYDKLPNVIIIVILPYDPFDQNRMVYTIRNHCHEVPNLPYDDGARKIFLYTKGTQGNPSQSLKDMLKYIQESTKENVTNEDIASIEQLVNKVKHKKEVGINYMKSWEVEEMARKQGYQDGFDEGFNNGFNDGFNDAAKKMNQLIIFLTEANRTDDILKAAKDSAYQNLLFKEFNL